MASSAHQYYDSRRSSIGYIELATQWIHPQYGSYWINTESDNNTCSGRSSYFGCCSPRLSGWSEFPPMIQGTPWYQLSLGRISSNLLGLEFDILSGFSFTITNLAIFMEIFTLFCPCWSWNIYKIQLGGHSGVIYSKIGEDYVVFGMCTLTTGC